MDVHHFVLKMINSHIVLFCIFEYGYEDVSYIRTLKHEFSGFYIHVTEEVAYKEGNYNKYSTTRFPRSVPL